MKSDSQSLPAPGTGSGRNKALDILRCLAIIFVVTIHVCTYGLQQPLGSADWCASVVYNSMSRSSIYLFFMCSGALMLDPGKTLSLRSLYFRSLPRLIVAMFFWAFMYKLFHLLLAGLFTAADIFKCFKEVLLFNHEFHLYFLHVMLLVYVFLPITRSFIAGAGDGTVRYFLIVWLGVSAVFPLVMRFWPFNLITGYPLQWEMNFSYTAIGFGILGWYLKKRRFVCKWLFAVLALTGAGLIAGLSFWDSFRIGALSDTYFGFRPFVLMLSVGIYGFVIACVPPEAESDKRLAFLSRSTFCIYLTHMFYLYTFITFFSVFGVVPCMVLIPALVLGICLCGAALYFVLSRIPWVKKYLV